MRASPSARPPPPSRALYEEERERRRELKGECTALRDRVLILEARLAVSERQNTPSKASSSTTNSPLRCTADDVDPIEESIRLVFERNKFLEARVKQLQLGEQQEKRTEHQQQPPNPTFAKEFHVGRKMLQVQEEIEATLTAEVGRLRHVVKAQRHAIQRLVSNPSSVLEPGEYSRLTSHASPARQSSCPGRRQPAATSSAVAVGCKMRSLSSSGAAAGGSKRPLALQQRTHGAAAHGHAARLRTSERVTSGQRRGEASGVLDLLGCNGSGSPTKRSPSRGQHGGEMFLDISDDSSGDDDDNGDCEDGDALPQFKLSSPTRAGPGKNSSNRSIAGSPTRVAASSSTRPSSPDQARKPSSAESSSSSSSNVEHAAPFRPTRGKEIIPNIIDFGLLNLAPALVDANYENRVHAEANKHEHYSPSKHKPQTSPVPRRSPVGSPPSRSPSSRPARKTPPPSRKTASKISQALQLEVDKILREIEASLKESDLE